MNIEYITLSTNCLRRLRISGYSLVDAEVLKEKYGLEFFKIKTDRKNNKLYIFKVINNGVLIFAKLKYSF
jgi:hypothetical protein